MFLKRRSCRPVTSPIRNKNTPCHIRRRSAVCMRFSFNRWRHHSADRGVHNVSDLPTPKALYVGVVDGHPRLLAQPGQSAALRLRSSLGMRPASVNTDCQAAGGMRLIVVSTRANTACLFSVDTSVVSGVNESAAETLRPREADEPRFPQVATPGTTGVITAQLQHRDTSGSASRTFRRSV